jgi:hypothetical protein
MENLVDQQLIERLFPGCKQCLVYADDTLLLLSPSEQQLTIIKVLLDVYGQLSGLKINLNKSELLLTSACTQETQHLAQLIGCKQAKFPLMYLEWSLPDKKLKNVQYTSLIQKLQGTLSNWKAPLLSPGGRLTVVDTTLTAMSIFFMSTFMLPKWVMAEIDKIRRCFLWHGHRDHPEARHITMISWDKVIKPKSVREGA